MPLIVVLALGWCAGIWAAAQVSQPGWAWLIIAGLGGGGLYYFRAAPQVRLPLVFILCVGLGGARYEWARPAYSPSFLATYNDVGEVVLEGVVWDRPDARETRTNLRLRVDTLLLPGAQTPISVHGLALVYGPRYSDSRLAAAGDGDFRYGDRLRVHGVLETPPAFEDFSYRDHIARHGLYAQVRQARVVFVAARQGNPVAQAFFDFKARTLRVLEQIFPEPHAALLQGILLGVESGIPRSLKEDFSDTGTSHIVAISGFNVALIAGLFAATTSRLFGAQRGAVIAILSIAVYTLLVGASASVVRAAIMGSLSIVAGRLGRRGDGLNTLSAAALLMTLANPLTLWDVGFQLSVAATLGLVLYAEPFDLAFERFVARWLPAEHARRLTAVVSELFLLTLAAQITTLPLITYYFRRVSLISFVANIIILPVQPAVMMVAGVALILGLIWLPLGQIAAWAAWPFTAFTIAFVELFARVPGASVGLGDMGPLFLAGTYGALFGLTWWLRRPPESRPEWWARFTAGWLPNAALTAAGVGALIVWSWHFSLPDQPGRLKVTVLNVGQGEAVLAQTPSGVNVLVNGGPSGRALSRALARHLPLFAGQIDLLVIAAPRDENVAGLADVFHRYDVRRALVTGAPGKSAAYQTLIDRLNTRGIEIVNAADLPAFDLGAGARLRVVYDGPNGAALRLEHGLASVVLPVGLTASDESALLARGLVEPATALLVAAAGADTATQENWVWAVNPQVALISVAPGNSYGHPSPDVLARLAGRTILRTDRHGSLTLTMDGRHLWVETER